MNQVAKTNALIRSIESQYLPGKWLGPDGFRDHARALARKLDAIAKVMEMPAEHWREVATRNKAIRVILERD